LNAGREREKKKKHSVKEIYAKQQ